MVMESCFPVTFASNCYFFPWILIVQFEIMKFATILEPELSGIGIGISFLHLVVSTRKSGQDFRQGTQ